MGGADSLRMATRSNRAGHSGVASVFAVTRVRKRVTRVAVVHRNMMSHLFAGNAWGPYSRMRTFNLPRVESRFSRWLWRLTIAVTGVHLALSCWSMYRRIWQVQLIEVVAPSSALRSGSTVGFDVVTSGETRNQIRLELVQGDRRAVLLEQLSDVNRISTYDPRLFRYRRNVLIGSDLLSCFHVGPASLRVTAFGGMKLLRTPAPRVREIVVQLAPLSLTTRTPVQRCDLSSRVAAWR